MSYVTKLQTLSREDAAKMIQAKMSLLALENLTSKSPITEGKMDGAYSESNPKVDLYVDGKYQASTNWSSNSAAAIAAMEKKHPNVKGRVTAVLAKKKKANESVVDEKEEEYQDEDTSNEVDEGTNKVFSRVKKFLGTGKSKEIAEGVRKVDSYAAGRHTATIHKDSDLQEYKVKFMEDGKHHEPSDYFCDDLEDAKDTAKYQCDVNHKKDTDKATK